MLQSACPALRPQMAPSNRLLGRMLVIQMTSQLLQACVGAELAQMALELKVKLSSTSDEFRFRIRRNNYCLLDYVHDWK